jgi:hypothetical protein
LSSATGSLGALLWIGWFGFFFIPAAIFGFWFKGTFYVEFIV